MNFAKNEIIYLTGSSGYLGGYLCAKFEEDDSVSKVYCPIRSKKGFTGPERLVKLLPHKKCHYISTGDPIPADVTHVILNAYATRFDEPIGRKLEQSVIPILCLLDQCAQHKSVMSVVFVSTAFVQPPLPYRRSQSSRLPLLLMTDEEAQSSPWKSAKQVFDALIANKNDDRVLGRLLPNLHPYYKSNSYVFSKHLLEHMLEEMYQQNLNICIVRPSIVAPPRSLDYGLHTKAAAPLLLQLAQMPIVFAPKTRGTINLVFLDDVHNDIGLAMNATRVSKRVDIVSSTGTNNETPLIFKVTAPHIPRAMNLSDLWLMNLIRWLEYWLVYFIVGTKLAKLLQTVYDNYDFFLDQSWDFEPRHRVPVLDVFDQRKSTYHRNFAKVTKKERKERANHHGIMYTYGLPSMITMMILLLTFGARKLE